jgi:hypothetical protein
MKSNLFAKLGAVIYVLWGLLHLKAAQMMMVMGQSLEVGVLQGRIFQHAWNLLFFALFGIVVAVWMNWKNSRLGYWLNFVVISAADIGFILFVLLPGHAPMMPGALGPILWIVALALTTLGVMRSSSETQSA